MRRIQNIQPSKIYLQDAYLQRTKIEERIVAVS
jgi:hypothetical protein